MRENIHIYGRGIVMPRLSSDHTQISLSDRHDIVVCPQPLLPAPTLEIQVDMTIDKIVEDHFFGARWQFIPK